MADHREAFRRVGMSNDGRAINYFLQQILMEVVSAPDAGALYRNEGRRSLARELKAMLEAGYAEQQSGSGNAADADGVVRLARSEPVRYDEKRRLGRRVEPYADAKPGE